MADYSKLMYPGEDAYFQQNRGTAGMFTQDGRILSNPYWPSTEQMREAVYQNELLRLKMEQMGISPAAMPTVQQRMNLRGTPYADNESALRQTLAARQLTGDPSGGQPTPQQRKFNKWIAK